MTGMWRMRVAARRRFWCLPAMPIQNLLAALATWCARHAGRAALLGGVLALLAGFAVVLTAATGAVLARRCRTT